MPAAAHGATVSGVNNSELASLRQTAAMLAGRTSKSSSLTLVLATQADANYHPIFDATLDRRSSGIRESVLGGSRGLGKGFV